MRLKICVSFSLPYISVLEIVDSLANRSLLFDYSPYQIKLNFSRTAKRFHLLEDNAHLSMYLTKNFSCNFQKKRLR